MSESQERMWRSSSRTSSTRSWRSARSGTSMATVIGEVDRQRPARRSSGTASTIVDVPPRTVAHEGPVYERPYARPSWQDALQADDAERALPRPTTGDELRATLLRMVASPNLASKSWVTDQYDRYVLGNTVLAQPEDAGVVRRRRGDRPRRRARHRRQRPVRQARPVRRRAARAGRGLPQRRRDRRQAARRHQLPELRLARGPGRDVAVRRGDPRAGRRLPRARRAGHRRQRQLLQPDRRRGDPPDAGGRRARRASTTSRRRTPIGFGADGRRRCCCSATTRDELGGSEWAHVVHGHLGGRPPAVDLAAEQALGRRAGRRGRATALVDAAHDLSDGGLAQALVEMACAAASARRVELPTASTRSSRCSASRRPGPSWRCRPTGSRTLEARASSYGVPVTRLGHHGRRIPCRARGSRRSAVDELRAAHEGTLPALFG